MPGTRDLHAGAETAAVVQSADRGAPGPIAVATRARRPSDVLALQHAAGNQAVCRLLARQPTFTTETPTPLRADETTGPNRFLADTIIVNGKFAMFLPAAWIAKYNFADPTAMTDIKVHVFFGAGGIQGDDFNDVLLHGLRTASNLTEWITIAVPGTVIGNQNAATPFHDQDIADCLSILHITNPVSSLRLTGHSRGAISLVSYARTTRLNKGVIDRVTLLDEFQVGDPGKGNYSGKVEAIVAAGIPPAKIRGYETQNPAKVHVRGVQYITLDAHCMAAIGAVRMIQDGIALDAAVAAKAATTRTTPDPDHPATMRTVKDEVDALALPARMSLPSTAPAGTDSLQTWCADPANRRRIRKLSLDRLLAFVSTQNLTHYPGQNWAPFAAHEFFVAEIAEELYD